MRHRQVANWLFWGVAVALMLAGDQMPAGIGVVAQVWSSQNWSSNELLIRSPWRRVSPLAESPAVAGQEPRQAIFELDLAVLRQRLLGAPLEQVCAARDSHLILDLPTPDGDFARFRIVESPILAPDLATRFPNIKTYAGQGVDDPTQTVRFDVTPQGVHAFVLGRQASAFTVLPTRTEPARYVVSSVGATAKRFGCELLYGTKNPPERVTASDSVTSMPIGSQLRRYRIAIAATSQFTNSFGGGTLAGGLAAVTTWLNGVNAVYERELAVRFVLVANNTNVIYTDPVTDPYPTPNTRAGLATVVRNDLAAKLGVDNYDIGHVLGIGTGGTAALGVVCSNASDGFGGPGPLKGAGVTQVSATAPVGNAFDLGVLCHELGHQCGATHTFNATALAGCQNNRNAATAWEVGSGSTIMAYPGICDTDNVVTGFDLRFHAGSLEQMESYLAMGGGASCVSFAPTGNTPPVVSAGLPLTIPRDTPFQLTATGSDADGDPLTYCWEQFDAAGNFVNPPYGDQPGDPPTTTRPLFRSFPPAPSPVRLFPSLPFILNNANVPPLVADGLQTGERLPSVTRALRFRVTARDNRAGGGGVSQAEAVVNVHGPAGPFQVNDVTGVWSAGSQRSVSWSIAGTDQPPINCSAVNIALSYDGGLTFTILVAGLPNTGTANIIVPPDAPSTTQARIRVEAANGTGVAGGNTFFDITDANFTISQTAAPPRQTTVGMFRPSNGFFYLRYTNTPGFADIDFFYGLAADVPVIGDWNGDGVETIGIFRNGQSFLRNSNSAGFADLPVIIITGTQPGDIPLAGDWDGDGIATVGVFRQGLFLLRNSNTSGAPDTVVAYGGGGDLPIVGDWNGDRADTIGVYRNGVFSLRNSNSAGLPDIEAAFGAAGDTPLAGDWNGDGVDTIGVFRVSGQSAQFFLSPANVTGPLPPPINYGLPTDRPVVGKWQ